MMRKHCISKLEGFDSVLNSQIGDLSSKLSESKIQMEQLMIIDDLEGFESENDENEKKEKNKSDSEMSIDPQDLDDALMDMSVGTSQIAAVLT